MFGSFASFNGIVQGALLNYLGLVDVSKLLSPDFRPLLTGGFWLEGGPLNRPLLAESGPSRLAANGQKRTLDSGVAQRPIGHSGMDIPA